MRVVFLYSGQTRSFGKCFTDPNGGHLSVWQSQRWQIARHFPQARCFASVADDDTGADIELLRLMFRDPVIEVVKQPDLPEPQGAATELQAATPYRISTTVQAILRQAWHLQKVYEMYEPEAKDDDIVVRIRPDLFFTRFVMPTVLPSIDQALAPYWGSYGGINDRFVFLGSRAAGAYFKAFDDLDAMLAEGAPLHPETLQHYALERRSMGVCHKLLADFVTMRTDGTFAHQVHTPIDPLLYLL